MEKTFSGHRISRRPDYDQMAIMTEHDNNDTYSRFEDVLVMLKCLIYYCAIAIAHNDLTVDGSQNVK